MQAFLNLDDENMDIEGEKAAAQAQLIRESNASYVMNNQKYLIKRQKKEEMPQYAKLYYLRLNKLRPLVKDAAAMKWKDIDSVANMAEGPRIVDNILDIKPFEDTVIIGTLFKEQKLKPSILNNIMGVLGQKKFEDGDGNFMYGNFVS